MAVMVVVVVVMMGGDEMAVTVVVVVVVMGGDEMVVVVMVMVVVVMMVVVMVMVVVVMMVVVMVMVVVVMMVVVMVMVVVVMMVVVMVMVVVVMAAAVVVVVMVMVVVVMMVVVMVMVAAAVVVVMVVVAVIGGDKMVMMVVVMVMMAAAEVVVMVVVVMVVVAVMGGGVSPCSLCGSLQEERVQDADSVQQQQQAHQQHSCTLDECFQFYTKEEQVLPWAPLPGREGGPAGGVAMGHRGLNVLQLPFQLAQDDAWKCPHCKVLQQGMVKLSLWTLPDILIIHLKRFCQVGERRNKLSTLVRFPLSGLNMAPHVAQRNTNSRLGPGPWPSWKQPACLPTAYPLDFLYDLYAVCNHHGSLQGGHYTAFCRNSLDGQWYSYDDSTVESLREDEVNTRGAYILFYQKRNCIPPWSASSSMRGGLESRPLVRGNGNRSVSMKAPAPSRIKQGPFKTMPLRWSFGPREKAPGPSVELVEYLESRGPRPPSQSIVPLLTGAAGGDEKSALPRPNVAASTEGKDSARANERGPARVSSGHPNHCPPPGSSEGPNAARKKEIAGQEIRLPKKFDLPLTVTPCLENERPRPEGQRTVNWGGSSQVGSRSSPPSPNAAWLRNKKDSRPDTSATVQGTLTLLRSVFWRKENRRHSRAEGSTQAAPASPARGRLSPGMGEQPRGSSPSLGAPESPARVLGTRPERDVRSAPSSLRLPRKAARPPRASALGSAPRGAPGEQTPYATLQRVKYHTLSLGRKKTLPESSF
ncbi:Ubiquitin carboxyl-terminal hydrolase 43 [Tupaia chinensis]|uniref:ubiquitinyl hydrolase 1 n=1 Tax=Tupaia chinensis TaxID=246437 RepID=L9JRE9_TUPCH|nr:Ubiquitin carboxyl-terminal hydrolase 43 [Tupaia chinensis]